MATPAEEPGTTARRAMALWKACEQEFIRAMEKDQRNQDEGNQQFSEYQDDCLFLHRLNPVKSLEFQSFKPGDRLDLPDFEGGEGVPLDAFLIACMPGSKAPHRMKMWQSFRDFNITRGDSLDSLSERTESDLLEAVGIQMKQDDAVGLPFSYSLLNIRNDFMDFCKRGGRTVNSNRVRHMVRVRTIRSLARRIISGEKLTEEHKGVLKSLTPAEEQTEITKLQMDPAQTRNWQALIADAKTPPKGRPRRIAKQAVDKKTS